MRPYQDFREVETIYHVTWHELVELESRLAKLLWEARQAGVSCRRWSDADRVFAPFRARLAELVGLAGRNRRHRVLGSVGAYEVAYWKLYAAVAELLPGHGGPEEAPEKRRGETAAETCPAAAGNVKSVAGRGAGGPAQETFMANTPRWTNLWNPPPPPATAGNGYGPSAGRPHKWRQAALPCRRRFGRDVIGFWLGGAVLGVGGCILGACMPYSHPVGVAISVLWWGIYLGCLGASLGALFALGMTRTPTSPVQQSGGGNKPPNGPAVPAISADHSSFFGGANPSGMDACISTTLSPMDVPGL